MCSCKKCRSLAALFFSEEGQVPLLLLEAAPVAVESTLATKFSNTNCLIRVFTHTARFSLLTCLCLLLMVLVLALALVLVHSRHMPSAQGEKILPWRISCTQRSLEG